MTTQVLVGIDLGTTRVKVGLITPDGRPMGFGRAECAMTVDPAAGIAEQDPEAWWTGLGVAVREAIRAAGDTSAAGETPGAAGAGAGGVEPIGICVAGHGPTLTAVDAEGRAVRPAMTWLDTRSTLERDELEAATGLRGS